METSVMVSRKAFEVPYARVELMRKDWNFKKSDTPQSCRGWRGFRKRELGRRTREGVIAEE